MGKDLNKPDRRLVPEMGGLAVILGFYVGIAVITTVAPFDVPGEILYASLSACLGAGVVGLLDDMFGLRKRTKALVPFLLALPLGAAVFRQGDQSLLGLDLGILIVFVVAVGVTSAAKTAMGTKCRNRSQNGGSGARSDNPASREPKVTATIPATVNQNVMRPPALRRRGGTRRRGDLSRPGPARRVPDPQAPGPARGEAARVGP